MRGAAPTKGSRTLLLLWLIVVLEVLSPVPLFLSIGAAYVLLARPPWFYDMVCGLYGRSPSARR